MNKNINPTVFEYEEIEYSVDYVYGSDGEIRYFNVVDENGVFIFEMDHEGSISKEDLINYMFEDDEDYVGEESLPPPIPMFEERSPEIERKLDEILKVLKKIEKNTRK